MYLFGLILNNRKRSNYPRHGDGGLVRFEIKRRGGGLPKLDRFGFVAWLLIALCLQQRAGIGVTFVLLAH